VRAVQLAYTLCGLHRYAVHTFLDRESVLETNKGNITYLF